MLGIMQAAIIGFVPEPTMSKVACWGFLCYICVPLHRACVEQHVQESCASVDRPAVSVYRECICGAAESAGALMVGPIFAAIGV